METIVYLIMYVLVKDVPGSQLSHKDAIMNNSNIFLSSWNSHSGTTDKSKRTEKPNDNSSKCREGGESSL